MAYLLAHRLSDRLERTRLAGRLSAARRHLDRRGVLAVFLSRFVFPALITPATNYVAGIGRLPLRRFSPAVVAGQLVYVTLFTGLGRLFSTQVPRIYDVASTASILALCLLVALACLVIIIRAIFRDKEM